MRSCRHNDENVGGVKPQWESVIVEGHGKYLKLLIFYGCNFR